MNPSKELTAEHNGEVIEGVPLRTLAELSVVITEGHRAAEDALRTWLDHAVEVGRALMEARPQVPLGQWCKWLEQQAIFRQTANIYWRVAVHEDALRAAGVLSRRPAERFLAVSQLGSGVSKAPPQKNIELRKQALLLSSEHELSQHEIARLLGVPQSTVRSWIYPDAIKRYQRQANEVAKEKRRVKAATREAELALQVRDTAHKVGGDYEKAVEYMTKLDQILGRAREQAADSPDRRKAAIEAHKHRDRAMDALRRGLGL